MIGPVQIQKEAQDNLCLQGACNLRGGDNKQTYFYISHIHDKMEGFSWHLMGAGEARRQSDPQCPHL